ncbi:biotin transporter BioY [Streptomyces sp. NPDC093248]|uniref:biotin transporter BioY n=1 Tax=Streptomyces sp. NPDC093248 TaxID=3155072 RepID=UPI0034287961
MSTAFRITPTTAKPTGLVLADLLPAEGAARTRARDAVLVLGGAALTGAAAQFAVPVPGSPVPVTGQTFAALLVAAALGARRGALALAVYTGAGVCGMPWFAQGASGTGMPTFGYLLGLVLAAAVVGGLARRGGDRSALRTACVMAAGSACVYAVGVPYLAVALHISLARAAVLGAWPYLAGDALKAALAMGVLPTAWRVLGSAARSERRGEPS